MKTTIKAKSAALIAVAFLASMIAAATPAAAQWRGPAVWGPRPGPWHGPAWSQAHRRARLGLAPRLLERRRLVQRLVGARGRGGSGRRRRGGAIIASSSAADCWQNRPVYDAYGRWLGNRTVNVCR